MKKFILTTAISAIAAIGFTGAAYAGAGDSPTLQKIAERGRNLPTGRIVV
jgi:hypothetical protein